MVLKKRKILNKLLKKDSKHDYVWKSQTVRRGKNKGYTILLTSAETNTGELTAPFVVEIANPSRVVVYEKFFDELYLAENHYNFFIYGEDRWEFE